MDMEIALSRGIPAMENAADFLRAELVAERRGLMDLWNCLTPSDALAGPLGGCIIAAVAGIAPRAADSACWNPPGRRTMGPGRLGGRQ